MARVRSMVECAVLVVCAGLVMFFPLETAQGIQQGTELCLSRIIPSILPMMTVSVLIVESGYAGRFGRLLAPVSRRLFGLPGEAGTAVLLSMIGGYPAGAKAVVGLYEKGAVTQEQAGKMALFCFCAGPAFLIGVVGGLTCSPALGWLLMGVQLVTVTITGLLVCRKKQPLSSETAVCETVYKRSLGDAVVASVSKSAAAMVQVCMYVILFSAVRALTERIGVSGAVSGLLSSLGVREQAAQAVMPVLLEVTGGCISAVSAGLPMVAFAVGFGGVSVQLQVLAIMEKLGVDKGKFFLVRLMQGGISALLTAAALEVLPEGTAIAASTGFASPALSGSPQGAVMLLVMCAMCVLCLPRDDVYGGKVQRQKNREIRR